MSARELVRAIAPAKVNLRLEVLGRRDDGYHEIRSWTLAIDLCDSLEVRPNRTGVVRLSLVGSGTSPDVPADASNLAFQAAHAALEEGRLRGTIGKEAGIDIALEKRIPSRAGLGGGSSDAAAAWIATAAAHGIEVENEARDRALAALGSDCVFFAAAQSTGFALCEGRGERVEPRPNPTPGIHIALVTPSIACSTGEVYRAFEGSSVARSVLGNDLEDAALRAFPGLGAWRRLLQGLGPWMLSGSGSTFFAVFETAAEAEAAVERVRGAAGEEGLLLRGSWTARPTGHGARLSDLS